MTFPPPAIYVLLLILVIPAAIWDLRTRRIPNWLTFGGVLLGVALNWFLYENDGLIASLKGLALAFGIYFVLYLLRGMGAGDVKLMAAVGAAAGPTNWQNWLGILVLTSIAGAVLGLLLVFAKRRGSQTAQNLFLILMSLRRGHAPYKDHPNLDVQSTEGIRLPHGVAIALGTIGFLCAGWIWAPK
jgi:prepilin peptidase CpaA